MKRREDIDFEDDYSENVTYDSMKENWSGVVGLLMVPLLILVVGLTLFTGMGNSTTPKQNFPDVGVGGGPPITIFPSPTITPTGYLQIIQ